MNLVRAWHRALLVALSVALLAPVSRAGSGRRAPDATYALIVGNNLPPQGEPLKPLRYADDDAIRLTGLFESLGARVTLLTVLAAASQARYPDAPARAKPPTKAEFASAVRAATPNSNRACGSAPPTNSARTRP